MKEQLDPKVATIREQLRRGEYTIDPAAVAEAILKRLQTR
jgi:anti-sigma28 factor (negative regulator of flagellin synthesis)